MEAILPLILIFVFFVIIVFGLLAFPIWTIVHCASAQERSTLAKAVWIVLMVLTWPIASYAYGLFASKTKVLQWLSGACIAASLFLGIGTMKGIEYIEDMATIKIGNHILQFEQLDTAQLSSTDRETLKNSLHALQEELRSGWDKYQEKGKVVILAEHYDMVAADNVVTHSEYMQWMNGFQARTELDRKTLQKMIHKKEPSQASETFQ